MTVLGIDGALSSFSAAVAVNGEIAASETIDARGALERGLAAIERVLGKSGVGPNALSRIAVGVGPGSFTGVRIAVSYAKALAIGWRAPLVSVNSYDLLEGEPLRERALAVVRGRPGIVCARFRDASRSASACGAPQDVLARIVGDDVASVTVFGSAEDVLDVLAERAIEVALATSVGVPAATAALLARYREPATSPHSVRPEYGELPVATVRLRSTEGTT